MFSAFELNLLERPTKAAGLEKALTLIVAKQGARVANNCRENFILRVTEPLSIVLMGKEKTNSKHYITLKAARHRGDKVTDGGMT